MKKMYGVVTAMTTPFLSTGEVDFQALDQETEFLIKSGVNCLYPCGTTGEMLLMTNEQREAVAEAVVKKAAGRVIVFIHVGAVRKEDTIRLANHAHRIGADGIGVVTPSFFGLTEREMIQYYVDVANSIPADFPMYLYNIPQCSTNDLSANACEEIAKLCPNVIGVKYSFCNMHRILDYLCVRNHDFSVLVGTDRLLLPALEIGCDGTVSGASSVFPEPFVEVYQNYLSNNKTGAVSALWDANDIVNKLEAGSRISIFKEVQRMRGLIGGFVHSPIMEVTEEEASELEKRFASVIQKYGKVNY